MSDLPTPTTTQNLPDGASVAAQHPVVVYLAGLSPGSRRAMTQALTVIAQIVTADDAADYKAIPWQYLRFQHTAVIRAHLEARYAHSTANKMLSALRGTLRAAWKLGLMSAEDYHKAASVESVKGETLPAGRAIAPGELIGLLNTCDQSPTGMRDAALLAVLYGCGLRRAETVALNLDDYDTVAGTLRIRGKGNKQRLTPVVGGVVTNLTDWLAQRGRRPGPLFWGTGNRNQKRRLTTQAVYKMLRTRAKAAGIERLSPHDLRRSFVSDLLDRGADIATVQKLAGHASVTTTARYDRRGEEVKRKAAEMLHVPYHGRTLAAQDEEA